MAHDDRRAFREAVARYLDLPADHVTLFWKGRVAMYAILEAAGITGGEVVIPAFTCVVVPNAILYAGARPVYAEIEPDTYHLDVSKLEARLTPRTKAILAQNTFGLAPPADELREIARRRGLLLIEDCAHGFGGSYRGKKNGTLADASFFSTQWNKPFSTGLGGIAVTPDASIAARLSEIEARAQAPSRQETAALAALLRVRRLFARPEAFALAATGYRALTRLGLVIGSSEPDEIAGAAMPHGFLKGMSGVQARAGLAALSRVDEDNRGRRAIAALYDEALSAMSLRPPIAPHHALHTYLKYPLRVRERDRLLERAATAGIAMSDWFCSPVHPVRGGWERWEYETGSNPVAEELSRSIVNLPTQPGVTENYARRVLAFLQKHRAWL